MALVARTPARRHAGARLARGDGLTVARAGRLRRGREALRTGEVALVVVPAPTAASSTASTDTRPEARDRPRCVVDDAVQRAAGPRRSRSRSTRARRAASRARATSTSSSPGLLGMNLMGERHLGARLRDRRRATQAPAQAARRDADAARRTTSASFVLSRLVFLILEVALLLGFAALVFGVPVRGSLRPARSPSACCRRSRSAALGLLIASRAQTIEGVSGLMNLVMMPMWVLSGVFFSSSRFPGRGPAVHPGASAHGDERRAAGHDAAGARAGARCSPELADHHGLAGRQLRRGGEAVPLALAPCRR